MHTHLLRTYVAALSRQEADIPRRYRAATTQLFGFPCICIGQKGGLIVECDGIHLGGGWGGSLAGGGGCDLARFVRLMT